MARLFLIFLFLPSVTFGEDCTSYSLANVRWVSGQPRLIAGFWWYSPGDLHWYSFGILLQVFYRNVVANNKEAKDALKFIWKLTGFNNFKYVVVVQNQCIENNVCKTGYTMFQSLPLPLLKQGESLGRSDTERNAPSRVTEMCLPGS